MTIQSRKLKVGPNKRGQPIPSKFKAKMIEDQLFKSSRQVKSISAIKISQNRQQVKVVVKGQSLSKDRLRSQHNF